jgi:hypothetical protein
VRDTIPDSMQRLPRRSTVTMGRGVLGGEAHPCVAVTEPGGPQGAAQIQPTTQKMWITAMAVMPFTNVTPP